MKYTNEEYNKFLADNCPLMFKDNCGNAISRIGSFMVDYKGRIKFWEWESYLYGMVLKEKINDDEFYFATHYVQDVFPEPTDLIKFFTEVEKIRLKNRIKYETRFLTEALKQLEGEE